MNLFDLFAKLHFDGKEFENGIRNAGNSMKNMGKTMTTFGNNITKVGKAASVVTAGVGTVLGAAFAKAKSYIGTYESAMATFKNSAQIGEQGAQALYDALLKVAKNSAYAREHFMSAGQSLVAMGLDADKTTRYIQAITDKVAQMGGSGTDIENMAELFGRLSIQTNLYTQDINQMVTAGIPAWDILATKYGVTTDEVKKMASEGLLPAAESLDTITDALETTDSASEMFKYSVAGLASELKNGTLTGTLDSLNSSFREFSLNLLGLDPATEAGKSNIQTLNTAISTFGETLRVVAEKFGFVGDWIKAGLENVTGFLEKFNNTVSAMPQDKAEGIARVIAGIAGSGPLLLGAGKAISGIGGAFQSVGGMFEWFGNGFSGIINKFKSFGDFMGSLMPSFSQIGSGILDIFRPLGEKIGGFLSPIGEKFTTVFSNIGNSITGFLAPLGEKVSGFLAPLGEKIGGFLGPVGEKIGGGLNGIMGKIGQFAPQIMSGFGSMFNFAVIGGAVLAGLGEIQQNFGDKISEISTFLIEKGPEMITNFANGILESLPNLIEQGGQLVQTLINVINANLPALIKAGIDILSSLVTGFAQQLPTLIPLALDTVITLVEALLDNIDALIDAGIAIIMGLAEGLINALPRLIDKIPVIIEKLLNAITENLPKLIEMGFTLLGKLIIGLVKAIPQLIEKAPEIIVALVKSLGDGLVKLWEVGQRLVEGLWNGINDMVGWIGEKIKEFGENIVGGLKSFFGIASPSKLMRDKVGKYVAEGIGTGFSEEIVDVKKSMVDDMNDLSNALTIDDIPYKASVIGKSDSNMVNAMSSLLMDSVGKEINVYIGSNKIASEIYDPFMNIMKNKEVRIGA